MSHDLKTPLTSIVSYADLFKKEPIESEKVRGYIEVLDRRSQQLKKLTTDLVEASKASSGALLDNLWGNAVKYAQSGTRLYMGIEQKDGETDLIIKPFPASLSTFRQRN